MYVSVLRIFCVRWAVLALFFGVFGGQKRGVCVLFWGYNEKYRVDFQQKEKNILSIRKKVVSLHPILKGNHGVLAQVARAFDWQSKGHRFDSDILHGKRFSRTSFFMCRARPVTAVVFCGVAFIPHNKSSHHALF